MTGGILKVIGLLLVVVGVLVLLAGLAAAGYGYVDENDNQEALLADPERSQMNEDLMMYGLMGAGGGFAVLIVGIIVAVAGGSVSRRAAPAPPPEAAPPRARGAWIAGAAVALALVVVLVVVMLTGGGNGSGLASLGGDSRTGLLDEATFDGQVRNAYSTPIESGTTDASQSTRTFPAPMGTTRADVEVTWTPQDTGTANLRFILEAQDGDSWRELDRVSGQGPLAMTLQGPDLDGATLRYRVFANDDAHLVMQQDFQVTVQFYGTR